MVNVTSSVRASMGNTVSGIPLLDLLPNAVGDAEPPVPLLLDLDAEPPEKGASVSPSDVGLTVGTFVRPSGVGLGVGGGGIGTPRCGGVGGTAGH